MVFSLKDIKLIIWDLDDTFWSGTITDEIGIKYIPENIELIKQLTDKGIINSICSKNDFSTIEEKFKKDKLENIWNLFVFPSINWETKGQRIKSIIEKMQLRDCNVLFVDDNKLNLKEAEFYCPNIKTMLPNEISKIIEQLPTISKNDENHSRLNQYKILEEKNKQQENFNSNEDFLLNSNIQVEIKNDCLQEKARILELINRTNQLNYTKIRIEASQLEELLINDEYANSYIKAKDNFGDYGIIGFFSLNKKQNKLLHFLFSCRTLGMGIEQYIYSQLNYPSLDIQGEVVCKLEKNKEVKWINQQTENIATQTKEKSSLKALFKGPCDLNSVLPYLNYDDGFLKTDFNTIDNEGKTTIESLSLNTCVNSQKLSKDTLNEILLDAPFLSKDIYKQIIFEKEFNIIVFSLLPEYRILQYRHKKTQAIIDVEYDYNLTDENNWEMIIEQRAHHHIWDIEKLKNFKNNFEYLGEIPVEVICENLNYLISKLPQNTHWIFILGSETNISNDLAKKSPLSKNILTIHKKYNPIIKQELKKYHNVDFIDLSSIITSDKQYTDFVDHYTRDVYYKLAIILSEKINIISNSSNIKTISKSAFLKKKFKKDLSKFLSNIFQIGNDKTSQGYKLGKFIKILGIKIKLYKNPKT